MGPKQASIQVGTNESHEILTVQISPRPDNDANARVPRSSPEPNICSMYIDDDVSDEYSSDDSLYVAQLIRKSGRSQPQQSSSRMKISYICSAPITIAEVQKGIEKDREHSSKRGNGTKKRRKPRVYPYEVRFVEEHPPIGSPTPDRPRKFCAISKSPWRVGLPLPRSGRRLHPMNEVHDVMMLMDCRSIFKERRELLSTVMSWKKVKTRRPATA
ncbi:hypothetical protein CVT26_004441 [Gymnopilus dilepis]|uniref:Uncharacterized protein n=1 Tax=Gymnopilus dilepis TaxID=231916 RepID=A0A409W701_9AGAR|nr:hypothetical protein CVT26_004441 [Gymnopilus dilepis]